MPTHPASNTTPPALPSHMTQPRWASLRSSDKIGGKTPVPEFHLLHFSLLCHFGSLNIFLTLVIAIGVVLRNRSTCVAMVAPGGTGDCTKPSPLRSWNLAHFMLRAHRWMPDRRTNIFFPTLLVAQVRPFPRQRFSSRLLMRRDI